MLMDLFDKIKIISKMPYPFTFYERITSSCYSDATMEPVTFTRATTIAHTKPYPFGKSMFTVDIRFDRSDAIQINIYLESLDYFKRAISFAEKISKLKFSRYTLIEIYNKESTFHNVRIWANDGWYWHNQPELKGHIDNYLQFI